MKFGFVAGASTGVAVMAAIAVVGSNVLQVAPVVEGHFRPAAREITVASAKKVGRKLVAFSGSSARLRDPECQFKRLEAFTGKRGGRFEQLEIDTPANIIRGPGIFFFSGWTVAANDVREFKENVFIDAIHRCYWLAVDVGLPAPVFLWYPWDVRTKLYTGTKAKEATDEN